MDNIRTVIKPLVVILVLIALAYGFVLRRPGGDIPRTDTELSDPGLTSEMDEQEYEIVTLLRPDAIQAIDNPDIYSADEADQEYEPEELVLGISIAGESRAYSTSFLDSHEIVNDNLGGRKIAVTW